MCALFGQKKFPHFLQKNLFFVLRKHDFSRKLEGGTGLQGVSSILNICHLYKITFSAPILNHFSLLCSVVLFIRVALITFVITTNTLFTVH